MGGDSEFTGYCFTKCYLGDTVKDKLGVACVRDEEYT
jgi:hypothetical protein